ncbi:MAG TPA: DUF1360 domain-containing protein [Verrucomicrobiae bacterium]|nr:DUF1360 domain-containing protein [Verrucomicrobiae bacterium]
MAAFSAILYLALAVSALAVTVSKGKVFIPFREKVAKWSSWWGELITCPYCLSHWLALVLVLIYQPRPVQSNIYLLDLLVSTMVVVAISAFSAGLILRAFGPAPSS